MQLDTMPSVTPALAEQIAHGNCILFLGSDISESADGYRGLPTQWELVDKLAQRCNYRGRYQSLPQMAQIFAHRRSEQELIVYLQQRLAETVNPLPIHEIIARIPFPYIFYAGWDSLLERALETQNVTPRLIVGSGDLGFDQHFSHVLYKLYGTIERPESLALTLEQQYTILRSPLLRSELLSLMSKKWLLMVGYAIDSDSVFVELYNQILQDSTNRPPAFVVQTLSRADDVAFWEALDIEPLTTSSPTKFLYTLAQAVARVDGREVTLPDIGHLSAAVAATQVDLHNHTIVMNRVLDTLGIGELVEESDVPLLNAEQVRDLEAMRAAYDRLSVGLPDVASAASMWLRQGNIEYARQNYDIAITYYERAIQAQADTAEAYYNLHYAYLAQSSELENAGQYEEAQQKLTEAFTAYQTALELNPTFSLLPPEYKIEAILGQGGMGVVYRVYEAQTERYLAIKLLRRAHMYNEKSILRFKREAELLQRLRHEHIVHYIASEQYKGRYLLVMEYLGQDTLAKRLSRGALTLDMSNQVVQQVGAGLEVAHKQGIIHRDIKPSNIFLLNDQAKLIDFGLAADFAAGSVSALGLATGTVRYMAPEQKSGVKLDQRVDIYALATVFYEALTGKHPDEGTYRQISEIVTGINLDLDIVIEKAREFRPEERYGDVLSFCQALAETVVMQPASRQSAWWRRYLSQLQWFISSVTVKSGSALLFLPLLSFFIGSILPLFIENGALKPSIRFGGLVVWDIFLANVFNNFYISSLAQRTRYATLITYTPIISTIIALCTAPFAWALFTAAGSPPVTRSNDISPVDYLWAGMLPHGIASLFIAFVCFSTIVSFINRAVRLNWSPVWGTRVAFAVIALILGVISLITVMIISS